MKKIIEVDLENELDIFEKYSREVANKNLIDYIINETDPFDKKELLSICFNNKTKLKENEYIPVIEKSLLNEYNKCIREIERNNIRQFIYVLVGILFLFISTIVAMNFIFQQIFLIGGWVLIWETIEIEMFADTELKRRKVILQKLIKSQLKEIDDK